ncbi:MAG: leucine-rich repeat domain-containing protein [Gammaproteobacteria bacterium]|nr:leucine-rich repeat domain-containing protein [Gammaproteobacteria bacterium]
MTDVIVHFERVDDPLDSFCITFRIDGETADSVNFYFSPFNGTLNRLTYYAGIQTHIDGLRSDGRFVRRNKGGIFSRWRERDTDAILVANGGLYNSLGNEGDFISVRNGFVWGEGRYRLCLRKSTRVDGEPLPANYDAEDIAFGWGRYLHTRVRMEATDLATNATTFIGALAVPGETISITRRNVLFGEIYGSPSPFPAEQVPNLTITVEGFTHNDEELAYGTITSVSNPIPASGAEPKMTRVSLAGADDELELAFGSFRGRYGVVRHPILPARPAIERVDVVAATDHRFLRAIWEARELITDGLLPDDANLRAVFVEDAAVGSVRWELTGAVGLSRLASAAPYVLSDAPEGVTLPQGAYNVRATPYSQADGQGAVGSTFSADFTVVAPPPNPGIRDNTLLAHVETALGTKLTDANRAEQMRRLTQLEVSGKNITSLRGLELAENLQVPKLPHNLIDDISPLAGLFQLTELNLTHNRIEDLQPLCDLHRLRQLDISENRIGELGPLSSLDSVERLNARGNALSSVQALASLTTLTHLELGDNEVSELHALAALTKLRVLDLSANRIDDLASVAALANLYHLDVSGNRVSDLWPLAALPGLRHLEASNNRIVELAPLASLLTLQRLGLEANWIGSIAPLAGLNGIRRLRIAGNRVWDFSPLFHLVNEGLIIEGQFEQLRAIMQADVW